MAKTNTKPVEKIIEKGGYENVVDRDVQLLAAWYHADGEGKDADSYAGKLREAIKNHPERDSFEVVRPAVERELIKTCISGRGSRVVAENELATMRRQFDYENASGVEKAIQKGICRDCRSKKRGRIGSEAGNLGGQTMRKQGNYEVGYGKPPVHTRFKKGQSGNPKGFPKGETKLAWALLRLLAMPCEDFGKYKPRTAAEEMAKALIIIASECDGPAGLRAVKIVCDRTEGKVR